jgi:hypothetical protein
MGCISSYYLSEMGTCVACPGAPQCQRCYSDNPSNCEYCSSGYFPSSDGLCQPCPGYCVYCQDASYCLVLNNQIGYVLVANSPSLQLISNSLAACDPGCSLCSPANPQICSICLDGYYLTS